MTQILRYLVLFWFTSFSLIVVAQNPPASSKIERLKIFIEGSGYGADHIRQSINFVDFVNDPATADVHLIVIREATGSGGYNYTVWFNSLRFEQINDFNLSVYTLPDETIHQTRSLLTNAIVKGLLPFFNEVSASDNYEVKVVPKPTSTNNELTDRWRSWVFRLSTTGGFDYEESKNGYNYTTTLKADKVTEKLKINNYVYFTERVTNYEEGDYQYRYNYKYMYTKAVFSLSDHWSTGGTLYGYQSSYYNTRWSVSYLHAVEYNFFPWDESNKRLLALAYSAGFESLGYYEKTIMGKMDETLPIHKVYLTSEIIQQWGDISVSMMGTQYLHDLSLYNLTFSTDVSFRVSKGLSFTVRLTAESVHNQIYIPESAYSLEDILLNNFDLPSRFELSGSLGISYRFGSIYNNVVNKRL
ncbi:hypothetical protein [Roseimarinus sediminis]|uniref:hypothetical protein n=1 Tax=Roseimarinus sediminis TaxID=1610899 RepID=UPI003D213DC5